MRTVTCDISLTFWGLEEASTHSKTKSYKKGSEKPNCLRFLAFLFDSTLVLLNVNTSEIIAVIFLIKHVLCLKGKKITGEKKKEKKSTVVYCGHNA